MMRVQYFAHIIGICATMCLGISCSPQDSKTPDVPISDFTLVRTFAHDTTSYTQGLEFDGDRLIESSGITRKSWLASVDLTTGIHDKKILFETDFAEGITIMGNKLFLLTMSSKKLYVFDKHTFALLKEVPLDYTGWGLCNDGHQLIFSTGDHILKTMDTTNFKVSNEIQVFEGEKPLSGINEMEYVNGFIFANVYTTDLIYMLDARSGKIYSKIDLTRLRQNALLTHPNIDVLNGIAHIKNKDEILVTGKFWPKYYQIKYDKSKISTPKF